MVLRLLCALLLSAASAFQPLSARRRHGTALRATRWFVKTEQFCAPFPVVKPHLEAHRAWVTALRDDGATITSGYRVDGEGKPGGGGMLFFAADSYADAEALVADVERLRAEFRAFVSKFGKEAEYAAKTVEEYERRVVVFGENLVRAARQQANDRGSATHGVTMFSDLTPEEFAEKYLGHVKLSSEERAKKRLAANEGRLIENLSTKHLPKEFDWRFKGAVTRVKDQGQCGSCWTFSTTGAIEGAHFVSEGKLVELSEQQLLDCDVGCDPDVPNACDSGCNGGLPSNAMEYIVEHGGIDTEKSYPYVGEKGECKASKGKVGATLANFSYVSDDEEQIAAALVKYGPLSIGINAAWMQSYLGGVACPWLCDAEALDHGVLIVGYYSSGFSPVRWSQEPFWVIKNSWSSAWGESGYYRVCKGQGTCGVNNMVVAAAAP